jgi:hypothetical protein
MMNDQPLTVERLIDLDFDSPSNKQIARVEESRAFKALRKRFKKNPVLWPATATHVIQALRNTLDIPVESLLVAGWSRYQPLLKYCDPKRYPPEVVSTVPLATHTIPARMSPYVSLMVDGRKMADIHFEVSVDLTLEGAVLTIQAGRFMALRTGRCHMKAALRCEGALLCEHKTKDYPFPGSISFGEGIPIAPSVVRGGEKQPVGEPAPLEQ